MVYDYHVVLGAITVLLALAGFATYIRSILIGETKPHVFTWLAFVLIDGTVFFIQFSEGGGAGSWLLGVVTALNAIIFILSLKRGEKDIRVVDWMYLTGAIFGIILWQGIDNALGAVVVLTITNTLAVAPTFRKSFLKPGEESVIIWALDIVKFTLSIFALESLTLTTAMFPAGIAITNSILTAMILIRRRQLAARPNTG